MEIGIAREGFSRPSALADAIREAGAQPHVDDAATLGSGYDCFLVRGWDDVSTLLEGGATVPILPIDRPVGLRPVDLESVEAAITALEQDQGVVEAHASLTITTNGESIQGVAQAMLMTAEPASISEYAVRCDGEEVAQYRADGMAIATPSGSSDYTRAAGGPILSRSTRGLVVVPIAPYRTDPDHWVLDAPVTFEVMRERGDVTLFVDGREVAPIDPGQTMSTELGEPFETIRVPQSRSPFDR